MKVSQYPSDSSPTMDDLLYLVDASGATKLSKKATIANLSKALGWVDVRAYGAKGDGVTDDTSAIQAAIDSIPSGGIVFFPTGTYRITSAVYVSVSSICLLGAGRNLTKIYANYTGVSPAILIKGSGGARVDYCYLGGFTLYSNSASMLQKGIESDYTVGLILRDIHLDYFGITPLSLLTTWESTFDNVRITNSGVDGSSSTGIIDLDTSAVVSGQCSQMNFSNLLMGNNYGSHLRFKNVNGDSAINFNNLIVETNAANDAGTDGNAMIDFHTATGIRFNNFFFTINTKTTQIATGSIIKNAPTFSRDIVFSNGQISVNGANFAPFDSLINFNTNGGDINFFNVFFDDENDKVSSKKFADVTVGGLSRLRFKQCTFNTALTYDNLFGNGYCIEGDLSIERAGAYSRHIVNPRYGFDENDSTPSVKDFNRWYTTNTNATTITMFDNGYTGQVIIVQILDGNTTVDFTDTNLKGNAGVDWSPSNGDWMECVFDGTSWYCSVHDCTA